jgi:asparagine synthetase B (glutamine-hydrolysing)
VSEAPGSMRTGLSEWYAGLDLAAARELGSSRLEGPGAARTGPVTIFEPARGVSVTTFGDPARPSVALFDGFLFDRTEQSTALGFRPGTASDVELLAKGYETWGAGVFREFEGRYLAAVWDGGRQRLLLGHDAMGRHPAFYAAGLNGFWFGPNVLTLAASGAVSGALNRTSLALGLLLYWPGASETFFEGVHRVRPGCYVEVSGSGEVREHEYWDPFPADDEPWLPDDTVLETFEPALAKAVDRCMALGPQGIMLSGGVDSVTIAALAMKRCREMGRDPLVAVSGQTGYALSYEEEMQTQVAHALSMPIDISTMGEWRGGREDVDLSLELTDQLPGPTHIWWVGTYTRFYRRAADRGLNVLLTGSGGDNWLGVAERHAADLLRAGNLAEFWRFVQADVGTGGASYRRSVRRLLWADGMRPHLETLWAKTAPAQKTAYHRRQWLSRLPEWLFPDPRDRAALVDRLLDTRTPALDSRGRSPRSHYRHYFKFLRNPYLHYENETAFHIEGWTGLALLSPYHDRTLVSMFNRISPRLLLYRTRYKGLLRPVVAKYLPGLGLENQRKHYKPEERDRDLRELRAGVARAWPESTFEALTRLGLVDKRALEREVRGLVEMSSAEAGRAFAILSHERWIQAWERRVLKHAHAQKQN